MVQSTCFIMRKLFILFVLITISHFVYSQVQPQQGSGSGTPGMPSFEGLISGRVIDSKTLEPVEYANVVVYSVRDSAMAYGAVTDMRGYFQLDKVKPGRYYVEVKFIGYTRKLITDVVINPQAKEAPLGRILIDPALQTVRETTVTAEALPVEFHIDKKVVNVSQDLTATGMTAVQVLENVPSVETDMEGNVSLRGSTSFTVLVDGRPTILKGSEALQQIPASSIDKIEIITNPSAKYDPDGVAGIINVILKKNRENGMSGIINLNAARGPQYGGDALMTYRTGKFNFIAGVDYRYDDSPGSQAFERKSWAEDTALYLIRKSDQNRLHQGKSARLGMEFTPTPNDMFTIQGNIGRRGFGMNLDMNNLTFNDPQTFREFSLRSTNDARSSIYGGGNMYYEHRFKGSSHKLESNIRYTFSDVDNNEEYEELLTDSLYIPIGSEGLYERSSDLGSRSEVEARVDYTNDKGKKGKLEAGFQFRAEGQETQYIYEAYDYDLDLWVSIPARDNHMTVKTNILSTYITYGGMLKKLGYKVGLRAEYDYRLLDQLDYKQQYLLDTINFFPSLHLSYELNKNNQFQASYSRRINRPRSWDLNPYPFYIDPYTVRVGNPNLLPELSNNYELSYLRRFGSSFATIQVYRRETSQVINRVGYLQGDTLIYTSQNLDRDYSTGFELTGNFELKKWWRLDLSANIYNYRITGEIVDSEVNQVTNTWRLRGSTTFILPAATRLQLSGFYNAPSVTAQGERDGFYVVTAALRQELLKKKMSVSIQVRDIFDSQIHSFTTIGPNFEASMEMDNLSPIYSINLTYRINNYKKSERGSNGNGGGEMEDMMF
jgi:outer membrane receptor protein involved in Fe transport